MALTFSVLMLVMLMAQKNKESKYTEAEGKDQETGKGSFCFTEDHLMAEKNQNNSKPDPKNPKLRSMETACTESKIQQSSWTPTQSFKHNTIVS